MGVLEEVSPQAVILAGGLGTRLRPLTNVLPTPLAPVAGRPFLFHLIELLAGQGIGNLVLCTGYRGGQIREACGGGEQWGVRLRYSHEVDELMGTAGALKMAEHLLARTFILLHGDSYLAIDYGLLKRFFLQGPFKRGALGMLVACCRGEGAAEAPNLLLDGGLVMEYRQRGGEGCSHVDTGVAVMRRDLLAMVQPRRPVSLEEEVFPALAGSGRLAALVVTRRFYDIGTPAGLALFEDYLAGRDRAGGGPLQA